jgi:uncharacterized RDD family membrane protein YckC|tara:strand:- start:5350 stop:5898 length:549 start_codon:yes stop_codon:yes gene_type:complete
MEQQNYVGFWARVGAAILDSLIFGLGGAILTLIFSFLIGWEISSLIMQIAVVVVVIYMDGTLGGTPGKLILGMKIVKEDGSYIGIPKAIFRYIGKIISTLILFLGHLMIAWDKRKQGLHDKIAGTFVVWKGGHSAPATEASVPKVKATPKSPPKAQKLPKASKPKESKPSTVSSIPKPPKVS